MDKHLKQERVKVSRRRTVIDNAYELPLERDLVLPDYYPDIFRVLKCTVEPSVISRSCNGSKLDMEISADIRVLYITENDRRINCIEQKMTLTRSVDMGAECGDPVVRIEPKCSNVNCRVVNKRRLDIRGAVTACVKVCCDEQTHVLSDARGAGVQLKKQMMTYPVDRISAAKRITVIEELEMSPSKPSVGTVLRCGCVISKGEQRIIAGKLMTKGEAEITMLYSCVNSAGEDTAETMRFSLPFSQIIDMEGIDESFEADVSISAAQCSVMPKGESSPVLECELVLNVYCTAVKYENRELVIDAFSTAYECSCETCTDRIEGAAVNVRTDSKVSCTLNTPESEKVNMYDCFAGCSQLSVMRDDEKGAFTVSGMVNFCAVGAGGSGVPFYIEKESAFETQVEIPKSVGSEADLEASAAVTGCSYYLGDGDTMEIKADLRIEGVIHSFLPDNVVSKLELSEQEQETVKNHCALKLCRCTQGEDIWDIAKRCRASVSAIMEENELTQGVPSSAMLLIPFTE